MDTYITWLYFYLNRGSTKGPLLLIDVWNSNYGTVLSNLGHNLSINVTGWSVLYNKKQCFTWNASAGEVTAAVVKPKTSHITVTAPVAAAIQPQAAQWGITRATFQQRTQLLHNQLELFKSCLCWIQTEKPSIDINGSLYLVECGKHTLLTSNFSLIVPARQSIINIIFKYYIIFIYILFGTVPP